MGLYSSFAFGIHYALEYGMAMTTKQAETERKLAQRILRLAVARAERSGNVFNNEKELWKIVVKMSHKSGRL